MSEQTAPLRIVRLDGDVAEVVLDQPQLLNRFDTALHHAFTEAIAALGRDLSVRAIALTSTGSAFSAGGDFDAMRLAHGDPAIQRRTVADARHLLEALLGVPQPIVAAIQGPAIGLGATVALSCDSVVAARGARIADPHVSVGLVAGDGGAIVWEAAVGILRAKRYLLSGDPLDAETGYAIGLVTDLVDQPDEAAPAARELATRIAALPPLAVQGTKQVLNRGLRRRVGELLELGLALEQQTMASADHLEAVNTFGERRTPTFTGN